jgi:hypothetical protein
MGWLILFISNVLAAEAIIARLPLINLNCTAVQVLPEVFRAKSSDEIPIVPGHLYRRYIRKCYPCVKKSAQCKTI